MNKLYQLLIALIMISSGTANAFWIGGGGGAGTPGGTNTQIQFNDGGAFGGSGGLTYDKTTRKMCVGEVIGGSGYTGDLQNNGGGSWGRYYNLNVTAPAQALSNGYSVKIVLSGADANEVFLGGQNALRLEHSITAPTNTTINDADGITASDTTMVVVSTTGYPVTGMIIIDSERIGYTGKTATSFTGCVRGSSGSIAAAHANNVVVIYVKEMERHIETFTSASVIVWFKIRANIAVTATDTNYRLYYGNAGAGAAPATIDNVFTKDYGENGLLRLYHMDEGVFPTADSSGNGFNGTVVGAPVWQGVDGGQWDGQTGTPFTKGLQNHLAVNNNGFNFADTGLPVGGSSRTVSFMFRATIAPIEGWGFMIVYGTWGAYYQTFIIALTSDGAIGFSQWGDACISTIGVVDGLWHYIVVTYNGTAVEIFVDNILRGNRNMTVNTTLPGAVHVGQYLLETGVSGNIDELRIYNRVLSGDERNAYYKRRMWVAGDTTVIDGNFANTAGKVMLGTTYGGLQVWGYAEYADNAAAIAAGLTVGTHYRTGDVLKVVH